LKAASENVGTQGWGTVIDGTGEEDGYETLDLDAFFAGETYLNEETGNFQQDPANFKDNRDKYIYMEEDPRLNDHYPTSQRSYLAGKAIDDMYTNESRENYFTAPGNFETCESQAAMCCWHRDRQYFDNNGNCNAQDCANQNPGDNTDLCWTEVDDEIFPYPGSDTEKQLHCHGLAWSNDLTDFNTKGKFNTLFYVSMYDHLKQRGYAESIAADPNIMSDQAMCGCVEDMAPVARSDCSELVATASYTTSIGADGVIEIEAVEGTFELDFQACEGFQYKDGVTQEQFAQTSRIKDLGLKGKTNDLSAYVYRLWLEENIDDAHVETIEETLIGYKDPSVNKSDANRAAACEKAFNERFPDQDYVEKEIE
jgi:hypothetical protein